MILIVGSTKGGVGKTTLAFNFAVALSKAGREVLLVDADSQATATLNTQLRKQELGEIGFTAVSLYGEAVILQVPQLAKKYQDIMEESNNTTSNLNKRMPHVVLKQGNMADVLVVFA